MQQPTAHNILKNVLLDAWKDRWSEQKWTTTMKRLLQPGGVADIYQIADVLFTQAFVGSTPNTVLLGYFNYGLKSGILSYAAILSAISKHEDLEKVTSLDYILRFLLQYIRKMNKRQIMEDSMMLCKALLAILQWLLRNIEHYLKGVHEVSSTDADKIIQSNCSTLHLLTTLERTSSLLTIARFEESSIWSHIETDLAVIKNAAVGHNMQNDVTISCNNVSQLARCHPKTSAAFCLPKIKGNESHHSMLVNMLILSEGEWNKMTDPDTLIQQLLLIAQLCELSMSELCLDLIRACMMGFLGSFEGKMKHKWSAVLFLTLPQHLKRLKSAVTTGSVSEIKIPSIDTDFETSVASAFAELLQYDSLLDMLDQITGNCDCMGWLIDRCVSFGVLKEDLANDLKSKRSSMPKVASQLPAVQAVEPGKLIKCESMARQLLSMLDITDYVSKQENLLTTLSQLTSNFNIILASFSVTHNVRKFAKKLIIFNDVVKSSSAEGVKSAQIRCMLFDFTFFYVCQIAEQYGKEAVLGCMADVDGTMPFLCNWISVYWPENKYNRSSKNTDPKGMLEIEDIRVKVLIDVLQSKRTQEQSPSLKKWHDMCINMPRAFVEMIKAWHYKVINKPDILNACDIICNTLSLAVRLSCLVEVEKYASTVPNAFSKEVEEVMQKLATHQPLKLAGQDIHIEKRMAMFKTTTEILLSESRHAHILKPVKESDSSCEDEDKFPAEILVELLVECRSVGWIDCQMLSQLDKLLRQSGAKWFCHQLVSQLLLQTRKDLVERTATVLGGIFLLDIESFTICLLRYEIPHYLTSEADHMLLSAPAGNVLAQLAVTCLAIVLHNISLQQKSCLAANSSKEKLTHQLLMLGNEIVTMSTNQVNTQEDGGPTKLRRLFSSTAEHDLAASAFSSILGVSENAYNSQSKHLVVEPVLKALSYTLNVMHMSLTERQPGPHIDFAIYFVYLASQCGDLVSQAVLQLMPLSMVAELTAIITAKDSTFKISKIDKDFSSFHFALSVSDLGNTFSRRVAAKAICQMVISE